MPDERQEQDAGARRHFTSLEYIQASRRGRCPDHLDREIPDEPTDSVTIIRSHRLGRCPDDLGRDV